MNNIYTAPLFSSWPKPFSGESLRECFGLKRKQAKQKAGNKKEALRSFSYFPNFFSSAY